MSDLTTMDEERKARKREQWKRWAACNKEYLKQRDKVGRSTEKYRADRRQRYAENPEPHRERCRKWRVENPDKQPTAEHIRIAHKKYRSIEANRERERQKEQERFKANPEKWRESHRKFYAKNTEKIYLKNKKWREDNRDRARNYVADRRAKELNATPKWLTDADRARIKLIYTMALREGKTVDHIVPLKNKIVCGLHVPWNMQLLSGVENSRKNN